MYPPPSRVGCGGCACVAAASNEEVPIWSHDFDEGPPKLEEHESEAVDRQSRKTEIERLMDMKVLKPVKRSKL